MVKHSPKKDRKKEDKGKEKKEEKDNYIRVESSYGKFERSFHVTDDIDASSVKASFKDGVLKVELNKKEEVKPNTWQDWAKVLVVFPGSIIFLIVMIIGAYS